MSIRRLTAILCLLMSLALLSLFRHGAYAGFSLWLYLVPAIFVVQLMLGHRFLRP